MKKSSAVSSAPTEHCIQSLAFRVGFLEEENARLKERIANLAELLKFYELLGVREVDIGQLYFKEVCYAPCQNGTAIQETYPAAA